VVAVKQTDQVPFQENIVTIDDYRKKINQLDSELLRIFNERAALALKIGVIKKEQNIPVYDPEREKRIFEAISASNPGPLENDAIVRLFERVIDESRSLERILTKGI
jgi:chorismate mutase